MIDWEEILMFVCATIAFLFFIGVFSFGIWSDYEIKKEYIEIEKARYQYQQCLEEKQ